ncbi:MAG TPA: LytTR family DNA-binding domain-containing protein [Candidatus Izemoplasmatales bacterium]|nr:LytTR family DNA-binding domain-containing protein [Candidatus Izemoplasmatales bacterium]
MFKLKTKHSKHKIVKERLKLIETPNYTYVITDDKDLVEDDKLNIVFNHADIPKVNDLLDLIVQGEAIYITGYNEHGQKRIECRHVHYIITQQDDVYASLQDTKLILKGKLYEYEERLSSKQFIRVSKYCLVNIGKINYIRTLLNSKLELQMTNGDLCEVNRGYLKEFKKALKL